eukprot:scaffold7209_cov551-Prasinococcus_capsulatus_cf.AAC.3
MAAPLRLLREVIDLLDVRASLHSTLSSSAPEGLALLLPGSCPPERTPAYLDEPRGGLNLVA